MPALPTTDWPSSKLELFKLGCHRVLLFCEMNGIEHPPVESVVEWHFPSTCAYYRPDEGIKIHLPSCGKPCGVSESRNWTWPGSTTDREPYGVLAHELGHHCDWLASIRRGSYFGDYGLAVRKESKEKELTSYCPNDHEWFAEMFRLFVTNPGLLEQLRPRTYKVLLLKWKPVGSNCWRRVLGSNVPDLVIRTLVNKGAW